MQLHSVHHRLLRLRRFRQILIGAIVFSVIVAFLIVPIEKQSPNRKIDSFSDGIWYVVQTITTVGYGDVTPVTEAGRALGIALQITGAVMFGSLIGIISSSMTRNRDEMYWGRLFDRLDDLSDRIEKIEHETRYLVKSDVETTQEKEQQKK